MKSKAFFLSLIFLFSSTCLFAQSTGLSGFDIHLYRPPADGNGILNLHGSEVLDPWRFKIGIVTEASHGLLAATDPTTGQSIRVVNDLVTSTFQGALGMTRFLQMGITLPVALFEQGTHFSTVKNYKTASFGDISLGLKLNLLKNSGGRPGLAFVSETSFPSGDTGKFTGTRTMGEEVKVAMDKKFGPLYIVVNTGYRTVGRTQVANLDVDDMITFGGGAAWTLPLMDRSVELMGEVDGASVLRSSRELTTPVEWMVGLRKHLHGGFVAEGSGGRGITTGVGGGEWRFVAGLHWSSALKSEVKAKKEETAILLETVYFGFNKDKFLPKYEPRLKAVADKINNKPQSRLKLRGHSDGEGEEKYNLDLSRHRAEGVWDFLTRQGISGKRLQIEAVGSQEPATDNRTKEGKSRNRRVEILETP